MKTLNLLFLTLIISACGRPGETPATCDSNAPIEKTDGRSAILVIGDSISIGYTPTVRADMPAYQVVHNPCNGQSSKWTLSQIDGWLDSRPTFEAISWNNGLHDIYSSTVRTDLTEYESNLHAIAQKIKAKTTHPLFVLTTYIPPGLPVGTNQDVLDRNVVAVTVMNAEGIPVLDLYTVSRTLDGEHVNHKPGDVHYTPYGYQVLGEAVVSELQSLGL